MYSTLSFKKEFEVKEIFVKDGNLFVVPKTMKKAEQTVNEIINIAKNIVVRLDAYTGKQTNYFAHVYKDDAYTMVGLNPPSAYIDNNGDTLLFCISGDWAPKEYTGRVWAYCYNTTKNRMQWINKNFTDERDVCGTVAPPIFYDHNKWIIQTHRGLHCMDANTGELIWKNLYWLEYYSDGKNDSIGGKAELFTMTFFPI